MAEDVGGALDAGLFIEHVFGASRVHALAGASRGEGACLP